MSTHPAIATPSPRSPLTLLDLPTPTPASTEVQIHNLYTTVGPLELHQADGGLLIVTHPRVLGDAFAGLVLAIGSEVRGLAPGDAVFGFAFRAQAEKGWQSIVVTDAVNVPKLPSNIDLEVAPAVPTNLVTAFHTLRHDLVLHLPWPRPVGYKPLLEPRVLVWGAASSVGQYVAQLLRYYGYRRVVAVASARHEAMLKSLGADAVFDYHDLGVVEHTREGGRVELVVDCIGSKPGSLAHVMRVVGGDAVVAVMLPVVFERASDERAPLYSMDPTAGLTWSEGVVVRGVRTHFWDRDLEMREILQREIVPRLLEIRAIKPNRIKVVEEASMLERAETALGLVRRGELSR